MAGIRIAISLLVLTAAIAAGPGVAQEAKTVRVVDDRGVTVEVPVKPQRIAAISYLAVDVSLALGINPVATTYMMPGRNPDFLGGLTRDIKQLGQRAKPNLELLSATKPDLIVAMKRYTAGNAEQLQKIAPYLAYDMELLSGSYREVSELARIMGSPERGAQLNAQFGRHLAEYAAKAPKDKQSSFIIMWAGDSPTAFHTENTAASIMVELGGRNIMGPMKNDRQFVSSISLETLLEKDPDIILVMEWQRSRTHENNPVWPLLSAVKKGRVHYVGDEWAESNGPIARELVLKEAAHYLYPNTFSAIDVKAEARRLIPAELRR